MRNTSLWTVGRIIKVDGDLLEILWESDDQKEVVPEKSKKFDGKNFSQLIFIPRIFSCIISNFDRPGYFDQI
jgi:hypothetical protein